MQEKGEEFWREKGLVGPDSDKIRDLFGRNAHVYDRANDIISLGLARLWRRQLVNWSGIGKNLLNQKIKKVLDCATGTGDLAFAFQRISPSIKVDACDFCLPMLEKAKEKAKKLLLPVKFEKADVMNLPYSDKVFDVTSIAYGLRNVKDPFKALSEMARVTRSQGVFLILETGGMKGFFVGGCLRLYFKVLVPFLGGWASGDPKAYKYLSHSSMTFPCGRSLKNLLESTELFSDIQYKSLLGGASFMYRCLVK